MKAVLPKEMLVSTPSFTPFQILPLQIRGLPFATDIRTVSPTDIRAFITCSCVTFFLETNWCARRFRFQEAHLRGAGAQETGDFDLGGALASYRGM